MLIDIRSLLDKYELGKCSVAWNERDVTILRKNKRNTAKVVSVDELVKFFDAYLKRKKCRKI